MNGLTLEAQATEIKRTIERSGRNDLDNVVQVGKASTSLEMAEKACEVMAWLTAETDRLRTELAAAAPAMKRPPIVRSGYTLTQHGNSVIVLAPSGKVTTVINQYLTEATAGEIIAASGRTEIPEKRR